MPHWVVKFSTRLIIQMPRQFGWLFAWLMDGGYSRLGLPELTLARVPRGSQWRTVLPKAVGLPFSAKFVYCGTWAEVASSSACGVVGNGGYHFVDSTDCGMCASTTCLRQSLPYPAACLCFALQKSLKKWQIRRRTWLPVPLHPPKVSLSLPLCLFSISFPACQRLDAGFCLFLLDVAKSKLIFHLINIPEMSFVHLFFDMLFCFIPHTVSLFPVYLSFCPWHRRTFHSLIQSPWATFAFRFTSIENEKRNGMKQNETKTFPFE